MHVQATISATGTVLDILRCSLHDGPGLRTTVFLKGCPLTCLWCHNPESQAPKPVVTLNDDLCDRCGRCAAACPHACHEVDRRIHHFDRTHCNACGACVLACPNNGLEIRGREMTVEQVMAEVRKDLDFYRDTGGGLTISGGEPMLQFAFTHALATAARAEGIHVAMETCGIASAERYRQVLPAIDLFLYDYKDTDPARHQRITGVSNQAILANLAMLHDAGVRLIVRCPLIPGLNDTDDHLAAIAALPKRLPRIEAVEIMPYHNMGNEKARRAGVPVRLDIPSADDAQKQQWTQRFARLGFSPAIS